MAVIRFEVWSRPESGTFARKFPLRDVRDFSMQLGIFGSGRLILPRDFARLDDILFIDPSNHANDNASMIRAFVGDTWLYDFYASRAEINFGDKGERIVSISGGGPGAAFDRVIVLPYDYNLNPSVQPDWVYGNSSELLTNPGFEDSSVGNLNFEGGVVEPWTALSGSDTNPLDVDLAVTQDEAQTGTYSLEIDPGKRHSGASIILPCTPGTELTINGYVKSNTSGRRITAAVKVQSGMTFASTNGYIFNGWHIVEIGNVARNPANNGLPGGSTDGTWQALGTIKVTPPAGVTELEYVVQDDHHNNTNGPVFYIDNFSLSGSGSGLEPWEPFGDWSTFELEATNVRTGDYSAEYVADSGAADTNGFLQRVTDLEIGKVYTFAGYFRHDDGGNVPIRMAAKRPSGTLVTSLHDASGWTNSTDFGTVDGSFANIFDGSTVTEWGTDVYGDNNNYNHYIKSDAGSAVTVGKVRWHTDDVAAFDKNPYKVKVQYSDDDISWFDAPGDSEWIYVGGDLSTPEPDGWKSLTFTASSHRYWRIQIAGNGGARLRMQELEWWLGGISYAPITQIPTGSGWTRASTTFVADTTEVDLLWAHSASGATPTIWSDDFSLTEGQGDSTIGKIWLDMLDDAATNHAPDRTALDWLVPTFSADVDSDGVAWDQSVSFSVKRGQVYRRIATFHGENFGYEVDIHPNASDLTIMEFDVFNPEGMGQDFTAGDGGAINRSGLVQFGPIIRREPIAGYAMVEGDEQWFGEDRNTVIEGVWGNTETYKGSDELLVGTLSDLAARLTTGKEAETIAVTFSGANLTPGIDYKLGDVVYLMLGENDVPRAAYRVTAISVSSGDPEPIFQVQFVSEGL